MKIWHLGQLKSTTNLFPRKKMQPSPYYGQPTTPLLGPLPLYTPETGQTLQQIRTTALEQKYRPMSPQARFQNLPRLPPPMTIGQMQPVFPPGAPGLQPLQGLRPMTPGRLAGGEFALARPSGAAPFYPPGRPIPGIAIAPEGQGLGLMTGPPKFATTPRPRSPVAPLMPPPLLQAPGQLPEWQQALRNPTATDIKRTETGQIVPAPNPGVFGNVIPREALPPTFPQMPMYPLPQYPTTPFQFGGPIPGLTPTPQRWQAPAVTQAQAEFAAQIDRSRLSTERSQRGPTAAYNLEELRTWASGLGLSKSGNKSDLVERISNKLREFNM
jgi:hypothetical protein